MVFSITSIIYYVVNLKLHRVVSYFFQLVILFKAPLNNIMMLLSATSIMLWLTSAASWNNDKLAHGRGLFEDT